MFYIFHNKNIFLDFIYLFSERGAKRGTKRGRETSICERNIDELPLICTPTRAWAHNPGMCPDQE